MYIVASLSRVIYVGVTSDLVGRVWQHKSGALDGFTKTYKCSRLVWYEEFKDIRFAIDREKQIKGWRREKKVALIEAVNPAWVDVAGNWFGKQFDK